MFVIIGFAVVIISVLGGFAEAGGPFLVLVQPAEFLIIGGAALGALLASAPKSVLQRIVEKTLGAIRGVSVTKATYLSDLKLMYELLYMAQEEGLIALEKHIETPAESAIFSKYADILAYKTLISFMTDTFRMVIIGGIASHDLESLMEGDIDTHHSDAKKPSMVLSKIADTMRGLGIVAAVLGIVAIPFAAADPFRVIPSIMLGSMVAATIAMLASVGDNAPHGGPIVLPVVDGRLMYVVAILLGTLTTALTINFVKRLTEEPAPASTK